MEMDKLLRIETTTQSVSNHSSQLYYTTFLVFSKINITKFQKINISKKKKWCDSSSLPHPKIKE